MTQRKRVRKISLPTDKGDNDEMSKDLTKYVTTAHAADLLGVKQRRIQVLLKEGIVKGTQLGHDWLVYTPSLEKYFVNKSKRGRPSSGAPTIQIEEKSNGQGI